MVVAQPFTKFFRTIVYLESHILYLVFKSFHNQCDVFIFGSLWFNWYIIYIGVRTWKNIFKKNISSLHYLFQTAETKSVSNCWSLAENYSGKKFDCGRGILCFCQVKTVNCSYFFNFFLCFCQVKTVNCSYFLNFFFYLFSCHLAKTQDHTTKINFFPERFSPVDQQLETDLGFSSLKQINQYKADKDLKTSRVTINITVWVTWHF